MYIQKICSANIFAKQKGNPHKASFSDCFNIVKFLKKYPNGWSHSALFECDFIGIQGIIV